MKQKVWKVIFGTSIVILLCCIGFFSYQYFGDIKSENELKVYEKTTSSNTEKILQNPIDFVSLQQKNSDIYAWIKIDNTNIDYPVLQAANGDNSYYMRKNIDREYDNNGVIFTENYNSTDFNDPVTVIYGHNIWTAGKMFYQLHKFEDSSFFDENEFFYIYTPDRRLTYKIYSAFEYDDRHIMKAFDFSDKAVLQEFIKSTLNPTALVKNTRADTTVTTDDKIVVLSTCIKAKSNMRYLVMGVLVNDEKTK